ncbi:MAG: preprotein translocase subunit SecG [Lactobacillus sp.]|jgi:preprotein translocase subunit SecG|nr:preprotein translocase subunit SecG [Lactobacillus sp.]
METVLLVIHLMVAIFLVGIILIQRSSGGALDGLGGGSGASSFLSARGTGNFLTKTTAILATIFIVTSISLSLYYRGGDRRAASILDTAPVSSAPVEPMVPVAGE